MEVEDATLSRFDFDASVGFPEIKILKAAGDK